jgi:hypothetical protein
MSLFNKLGAWVFLIVSGVLGIASTMFSGLSGQFSNCSMQCGWAIWDFVPCATGILICKTLGPIVQLTYFGLLGLSVLFFICAYVLFVGWGK